MSLAIQFGDLWTYSLSDTGTTHRLPISKLSEGLGHVHGRLEITIDDRPLPFLGYCGPSDVCFNEWVHELVEASGTLQATDPGRYVYDEGEEGQPAFQFVRMGDSVFVSVIASELSGAPAL